MTPQDAGQGGLEFTTGDPEKDVVLIQRRMDLAAGWFGQLFGSAENAPIYIAGIIAFLLVVAAILCFFVEGRTPPSDFWKFLSPLIALTLGFLFGRRTG